MNTSITILVQSLGWGLLHSVWQGLLIYCCLRVVLRISGELTARIRYHLSVGALAGSFAWFIYTCIAQYQRLQGVTIQVTQSGADPSATRSYALNTLPVHSYNGMFSGIINFVEPFFPVLVTLYVAGIAFLLIRLAVNLVQVRNYKTKGIVAADLYRSEWVQDWQEKLGISRKVRLFFSEKINVPMTMGALKPVILLPLAGMNNLSQDQLEAILLHELAHIKRHDYLFNIIQTVVETVLFFNPFTWLISRIIRKEREHCCDDVVLEYMHSPLPFAKALAELEVQRYSNMTLAATGSKYQLLNRIKRIMEMKKSTVNYTQFGIAALLIVALIVSVAWFSPVLAQTKKTTKEKKGNKTVTTTINTDRSGTTKSVTRTIIIDDKAKNNHGVHPNDVGNEEDIKKRVEEAMAEVDWQGIGKDVDMAVAKIDWDQVGGDVQVALNSVNWDELKDELANARVEIKKIDWDKIDG